MKRKILVLAVIAAISNIAYAEETVSTHCTNNELVLFSCTLKKHKTVSICASKDLSPNSGYMQYRFGKIGKIEITIPKSSKGLPDFTLQANKHPHAEYNNLVISKGSFYYSITSFRQLAKKSKDGYSVPPSSDSLSVEDTRKSMREGNIIFSDDCTSLVSPVDSSAISHLTGQSVE